MGASRAAHVSRRRPSSPARETRVCRGAAIGRTGLSMRRMVTGLAVVALSLVGLVPASGLIATTTANTYWGVNGRVNAIVQTADTLYAAGSVVFVCAHLVEIGDRVIICAYAELEAHEINTFVPTVLVLDEKNDYRFKEQYIKIVPEIGLEGLPDQIGR